LQDISNKDGAKMADEIIIEGETLEIDLPPHPVKTTIVTGIVKDRDGITWINCGWRAVLVGYVGAPPIYLQDGTRVPTSFGGTVAADGTFTGTLPANDAMIPPKTRWRITFFPLAVSASSTFDLSVSGANQGISTLITQNIVPPRFKLIPGNFGYDDSEISPTPKAGTPSCSYLNTTTGNLRIWNGTNFVDVTTGALPANAVQLLPHLNTGDLHISGTINTSKLVLQNTANGGHTQSDLEPTLNRYRFISQTAAGNAALGQFEFSAADGISAYKSFLIIDNDTGAQFSVPIMAASLHGNMAIVSGSADLGLSNVAGQYIFPDGLSAGVPDGMTDSRSAILEVLTAPSLGTWLQRLTSAGQPNVFWVRTMSVFSPGVWSAWHQFTATT
jgi:hypothetical protein